MPFPLVAAFDVDGDPAFVTIVYRPCLRSQTAKCRPDIQPTVSGETISLTGQIQAKDEGLSGVQDRWPTQGQLLDLGVNGPTGALPIRATVPSTAIANQTASQKPSM
jgi:hypothetical protein